MATRADPATSSHAFSRSKGAPTRPPPPPSRERSAQRVVSLPANSSERAERTAERPRACGSGAVGGGERVVGRHRRPRRGEGVVAAGLEARRLKDARLDRIPLLALLLPEEGVRLVEDELVCLRDRLVQDLPLVAGEVGLERVDGAEDGSDAAVSERAHRVGGSVRQCRWRREGAARVGNHTLRLLGDLVDGARDGREVGAALDEALEGAEESRVSAIILFCDAMEAILFSRRSSHGGHAAELINLYKVTALRRCESARACDSSASIDRALASVALLTLISAQPITICPPPTISCLPPSRPRRRGAAA